jgi:hypothetical protein
MALLGLFLLLAWIGLRDGLVPSLRAFVRLVGAGFPGPGRVGRFLNGDPGRFGNPLPWARIGPGSTPRGPTPWVVMTAVRARTARLARAFSDPPGGSD